MTISSTNGNLPNASQAFTLIVQKANQALNFGQLADRNFSTTSFTVTASSSLGPAYPVALTSATPATCSTSGNDVTMLAAGTCTITATQGGDANYNAAAISRSFQIVAVAPGAPMIGIATAGNASVTIAFTQPAFTGGSALVSHTATCGSQSSTAANSPITVSGLPNGVPVTCTVTAFNGSQISVPSAASNTVTPTAPSYVVSGSATPVAGGAVNCTSPVTTGSTTTCTVTPNTGYTLTNISGCGGSPGTNSPYTTAAITGACTVTAVFALNSYTVTGTANPVAGGTVACTSPVNHGTTTTCSVATNAGYVLSGATGCAGSLSGNSFTTGTITSACTVTTTFVQLITYNLVLEGAQETPANASTGTGSGTAVVDTVNNTISLNATFSGIGALTGAHLHGPGARGVAAGVKVGLNDLTSPIIETLTYLEADESAILAGNWYLNLHTAAFSGGELRAQLDNLGAANKTLTVAVSGAGNGTVTGTGINCPGDCSETVAHNTAVTLTATATTGSTFNGWSGACSGIGSCVVTMNFLKSVTATFTLSSYTVTGTANPAAGGTVNCTSPVNHGSTASCTVTPNAGYTLTNISGCGGTPGATSQYTTGTVTAACTVTATFSSPLALLKVVSRKSHGTAGDKDITLLHTEPIGGNVTTEPRAEQLGGHLIVFVFDAPVFGYSTINVADGQAVSITPTSVTSAGNELRILLPAPPDASRISIAVTGVSGSADAQTTIGFLYGDVSNSRKVTAADIAAVKASIGIISDTNFRADINSGGTINSTDVSVVKSRAGRALP